MTNSPLAQQVLHFLVAVGFLLFVLHLITKMAGVGEKAVRQLVNALLEALVNLLLLPFRLLTWLLKKFHS